MTTFNKRKVRCSICGTEAEYLGISSTYTFGSPDLDTRPPKMQRSTIIAWVQRCPKCGYCASDVSTARPEAQAVVIGQEYKDQLNDPTYPKLAASFLCKAILDREFKDFAAATWALIHAAWACDDSDQTEEAMACRQKAADMLVIAEEHGQQVADQDGASTAMLVDLLRRSGQLEQARITIAARRSSITADIIALILDFQTGLLDRNDISCHTIDDALKEIELAKKRTKSSMQRKEEHPMRKVGKESNKSKQKQKVSSFESPSVPSATSSKAKQKGSLNNVAGTWSEGDINLYRQLLQNLIANEEFEQAKIVAKHLTDLQPDDPYAWYLQGFALLALSDPEHAEPCLLRSMEIAGEDCWDCYQMSNARLLLGDLEGAVDWCNRAVKLDPDQPSFRWRLMEIYTIRGDLKAAIVVGKEALTKSAETSDEIKTRQTLSNLYLSMCAFDESAEHLKEALKLDTDNSELWFALGQCLSRQGKAKKALKAFQRAAEIDPNDSDTLYNIGDAFLSLGKPDSAVDPLLQAVRLKHDFRLAHYDLSLAFLELNKYREAEMSARAALRDDPEMAFQWSNLGIGATGNLGLALMNQGQMEEAEACFRRNLGLVASDYFNLGLTLFRTQRYTEALENFRRALELEPENPEFHNLLGQTYDALGQPIEAEQSLRRAIEIDENYALGYYDLGVILAKHEGQKQEALASFEQALKIDPNIAEAYYAIACLQALMQKEGPAMAFLKKSLQKGFTDIEYMEKDSDWDGFRKNPKFIRLLEKYRKK
ncbi:MAG: tetratricopeptide repeat protein [Pseudomonadota bacterium]